ncbi:MAG TPA: DNA-directed RNA polymerase subunit beta' [Planctomycetota bacterium]|nr:DNA-directed RNA polymerase subunit beta' [Planctomycetota bacterium]
METRYERVNDITAVSIRLASPTDIRNWSYGEVRKPETINYRTYRSEKDGLFCERIFGPEKDYECACGKYKGIKHKGIVCDRCGVKITHSRERRTRMGHINLAAPVAHIWFFKAMPSRLGTLLAMKTNHLERVVYFQDYVVIDPGNTDETKLAERQLLTEEEYRAARDKYGSKFEASMGAEAIKKLLQRLDLKKLSEDLRAELSETRSKQKSKDIVKRLKTVESLRNSENHPTWMVLDVIPVIPPDLRPLVLLESGNFASSDLNDLYRRLINRNNRLKKFLDLNAPEVIIRNEKRMLQQSVDALFDNGRCRRPVLGSSNRPLKSLTDMIKGKQGRFRENLLGKRVDYSARSVIVVGPDLKLHQCGLPKKIALELFQPFIIRRLKDLGLADTIRSAKKMLERKDEEVWDILEEVIQNHPVLLNRAPTLHRMGIQAFEPVLIEGNAIRIHPLVCTGFNADFDGDQMAVHLPLSLEAQVEARTLMLSTNNIFSPANGKPIMAPSQDIVLGCYYLTTEGPGTVEVLRDRDGKERLKLFGSPMEVFRASGDHKVRTHQRIRLKIHGRRTVMTEKETVDVEDAVIVTTVGRVLFDDILPKGMPFYNFALRKKRLSDVIVDCHKRLGKQATIKLLDDLKALGFRASTLAGLSFGKDDMRMPQRKASILDKAQKEVEHTEVQREQGNISEKERYNKVIDIWSHAREEVGREMMEELKADVRQGDPYKNPIYLMADSGARGSVEQVRQLAGMRGLMAKPSGAIIETPIKANFREGLKVLEYFSSTHGARKGLADTALKTADSGYLTRKLTDVTQNVVVTIIDCATTSGVRKGAVLKGERVEVPLWQQIRGRVALKTIRDVVTDELVVEAGRIITEDAAQRIERLGFDRVEVRSVLKCEASMGVCAMCYGADLSRGDLVEVGTAVGVIAAQSIGEPGTQLTMRTFHIGGTASRAVKDKDIVVFRPGKVEYRGGLKVVENEEGQRVVITRNGLVVVLDEKGLEVESREVPLGAVMFVADGDEITPAEAKKGRKICEWDPHTSPIIADVGGTVVFEDVVEGETMKHEQEAGSKKRRMVILEHKGDLHPHVLVKDKDGNVLHQYHLPERAIVEVKDGSRIKPGTLIAKRPREVQGTQDITGGLPRVTEIFEARTPKDPAVIAEIDGVVEFGEKKRGKRIIIVKNPETGVEKPHVQPHGKYERVSRGDRVKAGEPLIEGPLVPHDVLRISGEEVLQDYLLNEVQSVYRSQGVTIDDKHIETVLSQMLRKVKVTEPGDSEYLPGTVVDKHKFRLENERIREAQGKPAVAEPLLLGITKAALQSESFISAASFQETTKVLTEAAISGKRDRLMGLKENVILGRLIPAGTGFTEYHRTLIKHAFDPAAARPAPAARMEGAAS